MKNGCIRFIDSYRFFSSSLDGIVKTLAENKHKTLKDKIKTVGDHIKSNIVLEAEAVTSKERYNIDNNDDLKKEFPDEA